MLQLKKQQGLALSKVFFLPHCNFKQIISHYVDDVSFTMRVEEASLDNLNAILPNFGFASILEINWHKNMPYWCGQGTALGYAEKLQ